MCNEEDGGGEGTVEVTIVAGRSHIEGRSLVDTPTTTGMVARTMGMVGLATGLDPTRMPMATVGEGEVTGGESPIILHTRLEVAALEGIGAYLHAE
jgi:hypothetical protein